jgi:hypothetical protein
MEGEFAGSRVADGKVLTGEPVTGVRCVKASAVRVGDYIMVGGRACKVVTMSVSKTGKHGHAKVRLDFSDDGSECVVYRSEALVEIRE